MSRRSTGKRQRFEIFKRDGFTCQYCGRTPPAVVLVIDHLLPVASGGGEEITNKITSCEACNQGKADRLLSDVPAAVGELLEKSVERAEQLAEYNEFLLAQRKQYETTAIEIGTYWNDRLVGANQKGKWTFGADRITSVREFLTRLPIAEIYEAADLALSRTPARFNDDYRAFKYFCGVCWTKIRRREQA